MKVFQHLIKACCCQIEIFANEQQQDSRVIQTNCYLSALQKSPYASGNFVENVMDQRHHISSAGQVQNRVSEFYRFPFSYLKGTTWPMMALAQCKTTWCLAFVK